MIIGSLTNPIKNSPTSLAFHTEVPRALSHKLLCHELGVGTRDESLRMSAQEATMHALPLPKLIKWSGLKNVNSFDHLLENKLTIKDVIMGLC